MTSTALGHHRTICFDVEPARTLPVGHVEWQVTHVEFGTSLRGWLRALVTHDDGRRSWASLAIDQPRWFEDLIETALRQMPGSKRVNVTGTA